MRIAVCCPRCHSRYELDPGLRGQIIRCPNQVCRAAFQVQEDNGEAVGGSPEVTPHVPNRAGQIQAEEDASAAQHQSGSVGEIVPILGAEEAESASPTEEHGAPAGQASGGDVENLFPLLPTEPAAPPEAPSWHQPPPVRNRPAVPADVPEPVAPPPEPRWQDAPPPVRKPDTGAAAPPAPQRPLPRTQPSVDAGSGTPQAPPSPPGMSTPPPVRRPAGSGTSRPAAAEEAPPAPAADLHGVPTTRRHAWRFIVVLLLVVGGVFGGVAWWVATSLTRSEDERYRRAQDEFGNTRYAEAARSFADLARDFPQSERAKEYRFFAEYSQALQPAYEVGGDPNKGMEELHHFLQAHDRDPLLAPRRAPAGAAFDQIARSLAGQARGFLKPPRELDRAQQSLRDAELALTREKAYGESDNPGSAELLADVGREIARAERAQSTLAELRKLRPTAEDIRKGEQIVAREDLREDPEAREVLARLKEEFLGQVTYTSAPRKLPGPGNEPRDGGFVVLAAGGGGGSVPRAGEQVVFALARGMLYALALDDGRFLWGTRVGIDTTALPVRVPAGEAGGEMVLVISSDTPLLTARDLRSGQELWRYDLEVPCLGRPLLVGHSALVPTYDGKIHEIDVASGQLLGWYQVGVPLTVGGARQEGTDLVYFAAESLYVFVFDTKQRRCVAVLPSGHPSGSLLGAPVVVGSAVPDSRSSERPNLLILAQTDGLDGMKLRAFPLPVEGLGAASALEPELRLPGWSWFEAHCDGERIVLATDAGALGLFGLNQALNDDPPLFPLLPEEPTPVRRLPGQHPRKTLLAHARGDDFWVLRDGRLHRLQLAIERKKGLRLTDRWSESPPLGWPLHAGQADAGGETVVVVTQPAGQPNALATAVDAATGQARWRRRLGIFAQVDPLPVGQQVIVLDRGGSLMGFDGGEPGEGTDTFRAGGRVLAAPLPGLSSGPSYLLPGPDGRTVYALSALSVPGRGMCLGLRRYELGGETLTRNPPLPFRLAGTPAVGPDYLVLPLAGGSLMWQPLEGNGRLLVGSWARQPDPNAHGHVVHVGPGEFLTTDGDRGITRWRLTGDMATEEKTLTLENRIVAAPVVVSPEQVCVADAAGTVRLLRTADLEKVREWKVGGPITAGPYLADNRIGCVVDRHRLVMIDPAREEFWEYQSEGEGIVGHPRRVGDVILVADESGRFVGLDPATGKPRGPGYSLKGSAAPAGAPVAFGPETAFAPLTDGTVLLLSLTRLRGMP